MVGNSFSPGCLEALTTDTDPLTELMDPYVGYCKNGSVGCDVETVVLAILAIAGDDGSSLPVAV